MAQYNITQTDLLDQTTNDDDYAALGGQSVVDITSIRGSEAKVISQTWVHDVAIAITIFFDCRTYRRVVWLRLNGPFTGWNDEERPR